MFAGQKLNKYQKTRPPFPSPPKPIKKTNQPPDKHQASHLVQTGMLNSSNKSNEKKQKETISDILGLLFVPLSILMLFLTSVTFTHWLSTTDSWAPL